MRGAFGVGNHAWVYNVRGDECYCQSNPPEIEEDFRMDEAIAEATGMNDPNYRFNPKPRPLPPEEYARIRRAARS